MSVIVIFYVLVILAICAAIASVILGRRANAMWWPVAILVCFALGAAWQEVALRTFAAREPDGLRGMIIRPIPYGSGDHEIGPHGAHYANYSFVIPGAVTLIAALTIAVAGFVLSRGSAGVRASVFVALLSGALGYALLALARLLAASEIFI